jgi:hypothetical protein
MALKFRRGTAAQKSGSLAFGEPYVNTTLGTLQVGLDTGDLTLTSVGPTTQFGIQSISASAFVSASSIYSTNGITGSINFNNLTNVPSLISGSIQVLGGTGIISSSTQLNNTTIANLTVTNLTTVNETATVIFSSGSNRFGDFGDDIQSFTGSVQISGSLTTIGTSTATSFNGAINATNGIISGSSQVSYIGLNNIPSGIISSSAQIDTLFNIDGIVSGSSQITYASISSIPAGIVSGSSQITYTGISSIPAGIVSGSAQTIANLPTGTVSGSSQLNGTTISNLSGSFTGSFKGNLAGVADYGQTVAVSSVGTTTDTTLYPTFTTTAIIGSYSSLYSHASGSFYYNGVTRQVNAEGFVGGIFATNGVVSGSSQTIANLPTGTISGSSQVVGSSITTNTITIAGQSTALGSSVTAETIRTAIGTVVTGSAQISLTATTGYGTYLNQAVLTTSSPTFAALTINGAITATGDITAYYTSDKRHKNTIQLIPNALEKITKLNGVTWEWNDDVNEVTKSTPKTGLIAQEVQEVLPEVVKTRDDGFLALDYSKMMGLMVEAIKEQQTQIHSLTLEIEKLKEPKGL